MDDEESGLIDSLLGSKRHGYGAAVTNTHLTNSYQKPKSIISHKVLHTDSLSGLAIKYNTTVADIKRLNKLWNSESLVLRDTINIPLFASSSTAVNGGVDNPPPNNLPPKKTAPKPVADVSDVSLTVNSDSKTSEATTGSSNDFFAKFDQSMSALKKKVEHQAAKHPEYFEEDNVLYDSSLDRSKSRSRESTSSDNRHSYTSTTSYTSTAAEDMLTPEPEIRSNVMKKLEKHERRQDEELFIL